jgi:hypothetical protein
VTLPLWELTDDEATIDSMIEEERPHKISPLITILEPLFCQWLFPIHTVTLDVRSYKMDYCLLHDYSKRESLTGCLQSYADHGGRGPGFETRSGHGRYDCENIIVIRYNCNSLMTLQCCLTA